MKTLLLKYFSILALIFSAVWALDHSDKGWQLNWEALITFIICFIGYISLEGYDHIVSSRTPPAISEHDVKLYSQLFELLSPNSLHFFVEHDFLAPFNSNNTAPLFSYIDNWDTEERKFINQELQQEQEDFRSVAINFVSKLTEYTVPGEGNLLTVRPRVYGEIPDHIKEQARTLNSLSDEYVRSFRTFYNKCRIILNRSGSI